MSGAQETGSKKVEIRATTRPPAPRASGKPMQPSVIGAILRGFIGFRGSLLVVALALFGTLAGCSAKDATTGKRVTLKTRATVEADSRTEFSTSFGWSVKLDEAVVAVGALYYFDGEPPFVRRDTPRPGPLERVAGWFGEGVAHAHPGHYQAGDAVGQMLEPGSVDLFATPVALGAGEGVTGTYWSAEFRFASKAVGAAAGKLAGHVAVAKGTATRSGDGGSTTVHFRITADFADVAKNVTEGEVDGCAFKKSDVEDDGTVTLTFKPSVWFDLVDFANIAPGTAEAPTEIAAGDIAHTGFVLGLVQLTAYAFSYAG
jgi:hypothetical protein